MRGSTRELNSAGVSLWVDSISREMLDSGRLERYRDDFGLTGLTSNPTIFDKAIDSGNAYDQAIQDSRKDGPEEVFFDLAIDDLRRAAEIFHTVFKQTSGVDGWVSLEVSPLLADDTERSIEQALQLHRSAALENLFIKIPGTPAGLSAIEELIYQGVPINVTLLFSPCQYVEAALAYQRGLERRLKDGKHLDVASVASVFVSRWDVKVADRIPDTMRNQLGIAVGRRIYADYRRVLQSASMQRLMNKGARPQRLLWASTGTKDPHASDVLYVENLIAPLTVNTMPEKTIIAFAEHGRICTVLAADAKAADDALEPFTGMGLEVEAIGKELQEEGKVSFTKSWNALLPTIRTRMKVMS